MQNPDFNPGAVSKCSRWICNPAASGGLQIREERCEGDGRNMKRIGCKILISTRVLFHPQPSQGFCLRASLKPFPKSPKVQVELRPCVGGNSQSARLKRIDHE
ncbi:MAG: hypothetical protein HY869_16320 [Chloroflexi bacterium]|nr:hypothetical protein [Chloroflexota bacterium]